VSRSTKKPRRGPRVVSKGCRNHGSCPYCRTGREYKDKRRESPPAREDE
jgi:threonine dehydrogenase-like Zn-dependent dehydrogenase